MGDHQIAAGRWWVPSPATWTRSGGGEKCFWSNGRHQRVGENTGIYALFNTQA